MTEHPHGFARARFLEFRKKQGKAPSLLHQTVKARGLEFAVYTSPHAGDSLPLLCINGGLHFGHDVLWPALAPLARNRQLIFFDQRGRGKSSTSPAPRSSRIEFDAGDAIAIREAMGIERWNVLGHSWGGGIAMLATADDQAAVNKLVLVDAVGPSSAWLSQLHPAALSRLTGEKRDALARLDPNALHLDDIEAHAAYTSALYPAWFADREFAAIFSSPKANSITGAAVAARLRREGYDWTDRISKIRTPTLVIHGDHDLLDIRVAESIARLIPGSELSIVSHSGHMPFWESPEEFFNRVEKFLHSARHDFEARPR